jgi:hypothetical protein
MSDRRKAYETEHARASKIIQSRFDENVRKVFKRLRDDLPGGLAAFDEDLARLVEGYLTWRGVAHSRTVLAGNVVFEIQPGAALPDSAGEGRRFATGDTRALGDAEPLNLIHPLVRAAIHEVRSWQGSPIKLTVPPGADSELAALTGASGHLRLLLVEYAGFEPVQQLVAAAVIGSDPIDPALAAKISRLPASEGRFDEPQVHERWLDEAEEEALFADQREMEKSAQAHFERATGQLERFVEDKLLICRREQSAIAEQIRSAKTRRDEVVGSSSRERVEAEIVQLARRDEILTTQIDALDSREDEVYQRWRERYFELRYRRPTVTRLMQIPFQIVPWTRENPC